jgi:hypothetical protein
MNNVYCLNKPREDGKHQERFRITSVVFDTDGKKALAKKLAKRYTGNHFLADNKHDADERAADIVSNASGWCVFNVTFEPYTPENEGVRVISRTGKQSGRLTGTRRLCSLEGCRGERLTVRWNNGKISYPCTKGMTLNESKTGTFFWRIG